MNISPVTPYSQNYKSKLNFTSCTKIYSPKIITNLDIFSSDKVRTTSNVFRYDLDWDKLMKYIFLNFINEKKVNIWSLACSDGSEPISYALYLSSRTPEKLYKKFTPIHACDIDSEMIKIAKSGKINLYPEDFDKFDDYLKNKKQYFKLCGVPMKINNNVYCDERCYEISPEIQKMIKYKVSDILTEVKKIKKNENYVVNIRNVFPYLKEEYTNEVLETLSEKLRSGNIFVFGHYDYLVRNFRNKLYDLGFFTPIEGMNFVQKI